MPLPSPQQVVSAASPGRRNPFAPVAFATIPLPEGVTSGSPPALAIARVSKAGGDAAAQQLALQEALKLQAAAANHKAGSSAAAGPRGLVGLPNSVAKPPVNLVLTGVIQANGQREAVVANGSQNGSLRVGDRGGRTTTLIPAGWSVVAIHLGGSSPRDVPSLLLQKGNFRYPVKLL